MLATDDDLTNLETALDARRINPRIRVIMRMFDQGMAEKVGEGFGIDAAMSQSALSAPSFATAAVQPGIFNSYVVGPRLVVMQRWLVRRVGPLDGKTVGEVMDQHGLSVIEHRPPGGEEVLFPPTSTRLKAGDGIIVQGSFEKVAELQTRVMDIGGDGREGTKALRYEGTQGE